MKLKVAVSNKTGPFATRLPWSFGLPYRAAFVDTSMVVDARGEVIAGISDKPGIACAEVALGHGNPPAPPPLPAGRWFLPLTLASRLSTEFGQKCGMVRYALSLRRRRAALAG